MRDAGGEYAYLSADLALTLYMFAACDDAESLACVQSVLISHVQERNRPTFLLGDSAWPASVLRKNVPAVNINTYSRPCPEFIHEYDRQNDTLFDVKFTDNCAQQYRCKF